MPRFTFSALVVALALAVAPGAHADESAPEPRRPGPYFSVRFNPLALLIGRTSAEVEAWILPSFSVIANVFHVSFDDNHGGSSEDQTDATSSHLSLDGFELGGRYWYFRRRQHPFAWGAFVGVSAGPAWGKWTTFGFPYGNTSPTSSQVRAVHQYTGAVEGGVAVLLGPLFLETGLGLQKTLNTGADPSVPCDNILCLDSTHLYYGNGVVPRVLFSFGGAY